MRVLVAVVAAVLVACGPAPRPSQETADRHPSTLAGPFDPASDPDATPEDVELIARGGQLLLSSGECAHIHTSYVMPDDSGNPVPGHYVIECDDFTWRYLKRTSDGDVRVCGRARSDCELIE